MRCDKSLEVKKAERIHKGRTTEAVSYAEFSMSIRTLCTADSLLNTPSRTQQARIAEDYWWSFL
jgi:hypothetical protein